MTGSSEGSAFPDLVIHIGYHKAASTLLQRALFVEDRGFWSPWSQTYYHQSIMLDRPDRGWARRVRAAFADGIDDARARNLIPVLSCEALSGDMWRIGQSNGYGNFQVADLLAAAFPGARVLVVHREQTAMIGSLFKHSARSHWDASVHQFLDQTPLVVGMAPLLNLGYLEYSFLLDHYRSLFGRPQVLALPFELLLTDRREWARRLSTFTHAMVDADAFTVRENRGMSAVTARAKARLNQLIPQTAIPDATVTARLISTLAHEVDEVVPRSVVERSEQRLLAEVRQLVGTRFEADNRRLFSLVEEDWSRFGYAG